MKRKKNNEKLPSTSLQAPKLSPGQYSLLMADVNTGHVFQTNGDLFIGNGETFRSFNNLSKVHEYIDFLNEKNDNLEFVIYDYNGRAILYINRFERRK